MSLVTSEPQMLAAAEGTLQGIGSTMSAHNATAAGPTIGIVPALADEVSARCSPIRRPCSDVSGGQCSNGSVHALFATMLQAGGGS
jgi:hypothetical protein